MICKHQLRKIGLLFWKGSFGHRGFLIVAGHGVLPGGKTPGLKSCMQCGTDSFSLHRGKRELACLTSTQEWNWNIFLSFKWQYPPEKDISGSTRIGPCRTWYSNCTLIMYMRPIRTTGYWSTRRWKNHWEAGLIMRKWKIVLRWSAMEVLEGVASRFSEGRCRVSGAAVTFKYWWFVSAHKMLMLTLNWSQKLQAR